MEEEEEVEGKGGEEGRWNGKGRGRKGRKDKGRRKTRSELIGEETGGYIDQSYKLHSQWVQCQSGRWWK